METNIYQSLWDLDLQHNGCSVSAKDNDGNWIDPDADILIDEQGEAIRNTDAAPAPLFRFVNPDKLNSETYQAFIALLDNYIVKARRTEDFLGDNEVEDAEIEHFLDVILPTDVMQAAFVYIRDTLEAVADEAEFREKLLYIWFALHTNYYSEIPVPFASGFEHVMVGEEKSNGCGVGGYHSWIKFLLDERSGRVDFRGYNYDGKFNKSQKEGADFPYVATISMIWTLQNVHGRIIEVMEKPQGGFFVGPSPELQIAMGTIALFESLAGMFDQDLTGLPKDNRRAVRLMNGNFHLVMYRNTLSNKNRGDQIRSFWPKFIAPQNSTDTDLAIGPDSTTISDGLIRIVRALPNPQGPDFGTEWVGIESTADKIINLADWTIADKEGRRQAITGTIEPGKERRIFLGRTGPNTAQLGNKGGVIELYNELDTLVARVSYGNATSGAVMHFT